jgi:ABC-2 type transport system ATP-binding protein
MKPDIAISVQGVSKDFILPHEKKNNLKSVFTGMFRGTSRVETQHALHDISFEIPKGEFFGIVGRNGSGKSTMLKILAGIYQPTKGSVRTEGRIAPFIELGVGFNPELTGRENVYLNGAMLGFTTKEIDVRYKDIVEFSELERFMDQKLKNYSSGMQVRLAFAVATRAEAEILLVDEVLAVGDADFQAKCFSYFKKLKRDKKTVVFVTHDMDAVREYCDRAILINDSKLALEGRADKVATAYSRLFFEQEARAQTKQKRWGNNKVTIDKVAVTPKRATDDTKHISFSVTVTAHEAVEHAVAGFMVKDQSARPILGSNNLIERVEFKPLAKGERRTVTWTVPHVFARGVYYIDPSIIERDTTNVYDWWEEAASFVVHKDKVTPYVVNPPIQLDIAAA